MHFLARLMLHMFLEGKVALSLFLLSNRILLGILYLCLPLLQLQYLLLLDKHALLNKIQ